MPTEPDIAIEAQRAPALSDVYPRFDQAFPVLSATEIEVMRRFGVARRFHDGELLCETGKPGPGMFVLLKGSVTIRQRDGLGHVTPIVRQGAGQFLAEVGQLSGAVALVDGHLAVVR